MGESRADEACFLGARVGADTSESAYAGIVGLPWDAAVTYRGGASEGPRAIRTASDSIETYCPKLELDLEDGQYLDLGDLAVPAGDDLARTMKGLEDSVSALPDIALLGLGGDHLAALPFIGRALARHPDLQILHIDAHPDLRDDWEGEPLNHSTILHRVLDRMREPAMLHQWGIRSGLRAEFELIARDARIQRVPNTREAGLDTAQRLAASGRPLYVTLDVDGIDPADIPGTGTPEPDGLRFGDVEAVLDELARAPRAPGTRLVGADLVELAPSLDPTGRSSVAAARLVRTLLLVLRELA
jgi:agmatinase